MKNPLRISAKRSHDNEIPPMITLLKAES